VSSDPVSTVEAVKLAKKIASMPWDEVPETLRRMLRKRQLYRTVRALDQLLIDHPQHKTLAAKALNKIGLWHGG
jgi:hypothetical protein